MLDINYLREFDNGFKSYDEIMEYLQDRLYNEDGELNEAIADYFDKVYKANLNNSDGLSLEDPMCKTLEIMGNRLLKSNDIESNRKLEYRFWRDDREYRNYEESNNVGMTIVNDNGDSVELFDLIESDSEDGIAWTDYIDLSNYKIVRALFVSLNEMDKGVNGLPKILWSFHNFINDKIKLTAKEKEVFNMIVKTDNITDIANDLSVDKRRVDDRIRNICNKVVDSGYDILDVVPKDIVLNELLDTDKN